MEAQKYFIAAQEIKALKFFIMVAMKQAEKEYILAIQLIYQKLIYDVYNEGLYKVFLKYENPLIINFKGLAYYSNEGKKILDKIPNKLKKEHDTVIYKNIDDDNKRGAGEIADMIAVFNSNQIKDTLTTKEAIQI